MNTYSYDILTLESEALPIKFQADKLTEIQGKKTIQSNCRVIENGKAGFSATNTLAEKELIARARSLTPFGMSCNITLPKPQNLQKVDNYFKSTAALSTSVMVEAGKDIIARIKKGIGRDLPVDSFIIKDITSVTLRNSEGIDYHYQFTQAGIYATVTEAVEGDIHSVFEQDFNPDFARVRPQMIVDNIVEFYLKGKKADSVPSGSYQVLLHPYAVADFLYPFIIGIDGERIKDKTSPLRDKLGETIFHPSLTLWDDPYLADSADSASFDGEGVAARKRNFVEKGILQSFKHTLETAAILGMEPTGGARRSGGGKPYPSMFNLVCGKGEKSYKELQSNMDKGLFLRYMSGSGQANALAGEFSMGVYSGFMVEKGELTKRVKKIMLGGNIYDTLKKVVAVSKERMLADVLGVTAYLPYILLEGIAVAGS